MKNKEQKCKALPLVSVIVPIYEVQDYLERCIKSIIEQTYKNIEIILVDDGSKDGCPEICDRYAKKDSRITVIHKENGGVISARRVGIQAANGEFIQLVDGDDWIAKEMVAKLISCMIENKVDLVICSYFLVGKNKKKREGYLKGGYYSKKSLEQYVYPKMIYTGKYYECGVEPAVWNKLFRKELLKSVIYNVPSSIIMGEDAACIYPLILKIDSMYFLDEGLYYYRLNETSATRAYRRNQTLSTVELILYMQKQFEDKDIINIKLQLDFYHIFIFMINLSNECKAGLSKGFLKRYYNMRQFMKETDFKRVMQNQNLQNMGKHQRVALGLIKHHGLWFLMLMLALKNSILRF